MKYIVASLIAFGFAASALAQDSEPSKAAQESLQAVKNTVSKNSENNEKGKILLPPPPKNDGKKLSQSPVVVSIKIDGVIAVPQVYIVERALDFAKSQNAEVLLIDMNTPGGELGATLQLMEKISSFEGLTICYVNTDAISAGSIIACACDEIWFAPKGVMGAAEAVSSTGGDIDESMKRKVESFMDAKVRAFSGGNSRRAQVQKAMSSPEGVLLSKDGKLIKGEGVLLSLTAAEAVEEIDGGFLLGNGIAKNAEELLEKSLGLKNLKIKNFELNYLEKLAKFITKISPILLGIGFFLILIEFKTPNFGIIGGVGALFIIAVFFGAHLAGLSGYEPLVVCMVGLAMIVVELIFFPGIVFLALAGAILVVGSLAWALGGIIPNGLFYENASAFTVGVSKVFAGLVLAVVALSLAWKFLPDTRLWKNMVLAQTEPEGEKFSAVMGVNERLSKMVGKKGFVLTPLLPSGKVEIEGMAFDASTDGKHLEKGEKIEAIGFDPFGLKVKKIS